MPKGHGGPPLSFFLRPSPLSPSPFFPPLPFLPSPPLLYISPFSLPSLRSRPQIQLGSLGERCKLTQWGLGRSPCRQTIWCIFESKRAALVAAIFTALHVMQTRYCDEKSVCPSVRHTRVLWQNGRKICPDLYTVRKNIYLTFLRRRMVGGGDRFYVKFCVNRPPLERHRRFSTNNRS